jgi:hypothetical protein
MTMTECVLLEHQRRASVERALAWADMSEYERQKQLAEATAAGWLFTAAGILAEAKEVLLGYAPLR